MEQEMTQSKSNEMNLVNLGAMFCILSGHDNLYCLTLIVNYNLTTYFSLPES